MTPAHPEPFDVILGFDMETDVGSWTPFYEGLQHATPVLLRLLDRESATGTFFFVGDAARRFPNVVLQVRDAGHEIGCHSLYHETVGESIFPIAGMVPLLDHEVRPRLELATRWVSDAAGGLQMRSFRAPRLFGGAAVVRALEEMGYLADASLPMYHYTERLAPYRPDRNDWSRPGDLHIVEFPCFADVSIVSTDPFGRDRDQWPLFRTESAAALLVHVDAFIKHVRAANLPVVLTFYFHPWEFWPMPTGPIHYGEATVIPDPFLVANCGDYALEQFQLLLQGLKQRGGRFTTCARSAPDYLTAPSTSRLTAIPSLLASSSRHINIPSLYIASLRPGDLSRPTLHLAQCGLDGRQTAAYENRKHPCQTMETR